MLRTLGNRIIASTGKQETPAFLNVEKVLQQQLRTTFILKRRHAPRLSKIGCEQKPLKPKHYVYDLVEDTNVIKQPNIDVILTKYVEGLGNPGDKISVAPQFAYNNLLITGLAVYPTPENAEKYKPTERSEGVHSSPTAALTVKTLSRITLSVVMNKEMPWTLQPWHIRTSFRKCGYFVPEEAISIPDKPIKGPNMEIEGKEFYVTVTINNLEQVKVRCQIHHWSTDLSERLPYDFEFWKKNATPIFEDDAEILESLPKKCEEKAVK